MIEIEGKEKFSKIVKEKQKEIWKLEKEIKKLKKTIFKLSKKIVNNIVVSPHAEKRIKQRFGFNKREDIKEFIKEALSKYELVDYPDKNKGARICSLVKDVNFIIKKNSDCYYIVTTMNRSYLGYNSKKTSEKCISNLNIFFE